MGIRTFNTRHIIGSTCFFFSEMHVKLHVELTSNIRVYFVVTQSKSQNLTKTGMIGNTHLQFTQLSLIDCNYPFPAKKADIEKYNNNYIQVNIC